MKKVFALLIFGGLFLSTSCKKDYGCYCGNSIIGWGRLETYENTTKSDAESNCSTYQTTYQIGDPTGDCYAQSIN
jgi:hypothetical protein